MVNSISVYRKESKNNTKTTVYSCCAGSELIDAAAKWA